MKIKRLKIDESASKIEQDISKYRFTIKDGQMISEKDARILSLRIIKESQFITKFGQLLSIKIRLKRNDISNKTLISELLNWVASLKDLRSAFIEGLSEYPDRLGRLPDRGDGLYAEKTIFPRIENIKELLLCSEI